MKKNKFVFIQDIFDDQGGGGSFCSNCNYNLTWFPSIETLEEHQKKCKKCPQCQSVFYNNQVYNQKEKKENNMLILI